MLAIASAAPANANTGYAIDGLQIQPPQGAFGATPIGSCNLATYVGCEIRTFTLRNVGSSNIQIWGYGIYDLDPITAAMFPIIGDCSFLPITDGYWTLQPGSSCEIAVAFAATEKGRMENELRIWFPNQSTLIGLVPLFGVGIEKP
jgi:hypothetical protein